MAVTMITCSVQAFIEHEDWDDQDECKDYENKRKELITELEKFGTVDVASEDPWD